MQSELSLIEMIRKRSGVGVGWRKSLILGIGDDCAVLRARPGHDVLVTTDFSLETQHFTRDRHAPESVGHRVLARGLSDLAAMGAEPMAAFLSLALPAEVAADPQWLRRFLDGMLALARAAKCPLAGGDTSEAPGGLILADITVLGEAPSGTELRRSGARVGDAIYVTGTLGGAAAELRRAMAGKVRTGPTVAGERHPHFFPAPRLREGVMLRGKATAAMDLSDGLSSDLRQICRASGVRAEVELGMLPVAQGATVEDALHGGEDYELLFTAAAETKVPRGVNATRIGTVLQARKGLPLVEAVGADGVRRPLDAGGWEHFAR
jgi:thiamine-monophosphate kinase